MALKYWESILKRVNLTAHDRTGFEQMYYHRCDINRNWTEAAIAQGFKNAGYQVPNASHMNAFVNAFHNYIANKTVKARTQSQLFIKGRPQMAPVGAKRAGTGVVIQASQNHFVTSTGTYMNTILGNARREIRKEIKKRFPQLQHSKVNEITAPLEYAHGEGTDNRITTLGALSQGEKALNFGNSAEGTRELMTRLGDNFEKAPFIQQLTVAALRDYIQTDLKIEMDIDETTRGDTVTLRDEFIISGAAKIQETGEMFDKPNEPPIISGINKRYLEAVRKALAKEVSKGTIGNAEYESSPKAKDRIKSAAIKQLRLGLNKHLKKNPNFVVLAHGKHENFKKKASSVVKDKASRKKSTRKFNKANVAAGAAVAKTRMSPMALMNIINERLPETIKSKMSSPRLNNRTGRFAESARILNVTSGRRGGNLTMDYTYQKNPYQTFEPGFAQGSTYRDPRSIISASIRDIVTEMMGRRFLIMRRQ